MKKVLALLIAVSANTYAANPSPSSNTIGQISSTSSERTATFYLIGDGQKNVIRYKAEVFKWTEKGLEPTNDIVVFPKIKDVEPDKKYAFKVQSKIPRQDFEQTYRILFTVIDTKEEREAGKVSIVTNYSLPIFIAPTVPATTNIEKSQVGNKWIFKNTGNATYKTNKYVQDGKEFNGPIYIFPGSQREIEGKTVEMGKEIRK